MQIAFRIVFCLGTYCNKTQVVFKDFSNFKSSLNVESLNSSWYKEKCNTTIFCKLNGHQEGYIEELSTCFYLDSALLKSSENVLSET